MKKKQYKQAALAGSGLAAAFLAAYYGRFGADTAPTAAPSTLATKTAVSASG